MNRSDSEGTLDREDITIHLPEDLSLLKEKKVSSPQFNETQIRNSMYILLNICSSIGIVLTNKWVFEKENFTYGTLLTVIHFVFTFAGLLLCVKARLFVPKKIELMKVLPLCLSFCGFVVLTNLSLQYNSVGFYQTAKVLTTPVIMVIQTLYYQKKFSNPIQMSLFVTCIGVVITSATDVQVNFIGTFYAFLGVLVTSLYQIWVGTGQQELGVNSMQLLYYQAPISAVILLFCVPILDDVSGLMAYKWTTSAVTGIAVTGFLAFFVNLSTFLIIGTTSPVTYNVVGHFKLCLIVLLGFVIFQYAVDIRNISGILITLVGVFTYSYLKLNSY